MSDLPRVLFLSSESPHTQAAGAIVFHRLFADYPPDRMLVVTNHLPPAGAARLACRYAAVPLRADRLNRTRLWPWRAALRALGAPDWLSTRPVEAALQDFAPEVVLTLMQDSWFYDLAARFARQRRLPLGLFVHDLPQGFEPVAPWLQPRQRARDAAVYRQATKRWCISPGMADWFAAHYGVAGRVLLPPSGGETIGREPPASELRTPGRLTLGYAGGLHYGYGEQLLELVPVLRESNARLEYFGPPPTGAVARLAAATDVIQFNGYAPTPAEAWRTLGARCDVLLLPYLNPPGAHARQYQTHFPSKLGDCLGVGRPLLVTGPADASGVRWCQANEAGAICVTEPGPAPIKAALDRLRTDSALRQRLGDMARRAAGAFAPGALRQQLCEDLKDLARHR